MRVVVVGACCGCVEGVCVAHAFPRVKGSARSGRALRCFAHAVWTVQKAFICSCLGGILLPLVPDQGPAGAAGFAG